MPAPLQERISFKVLSKGTHPNRDNSICDPRGFVIYRASILDANGNHEYYERRYGASSRLQDIDSDD